VKNQFSRAVVAVAIVVTGIAGYLYYEETETVGALQYQLKDMYGPYKPRDTTYDLMMAGMLLGKMSALPGSIVESEKEEAEKIHKSDEEAYSKKSDDLMASYKEQYLYYRILVYTVPACILSWLTGIFVVGGPSGIKEEFVKLKKLFNKAS
jgi:hypothetical protein